MPLEKAESAFKGVEEEDWRAIRETLRLTSIPGMRDSINVGMSTQVDECHDEIDW